MQAPLTIEERVERLNQEVGQLKEQLALFLRLSSVSLADALMKARQILEYLVGLVLRAEGLEVSDNLLNNIEVLGAYDLSDDKSKKAAAKRRKNPSDPIPPPILPRIIYSSLHNLRMYGNLVVHPWDSQTMELKDVRLTPLDLQVALGQILRLVEWLFLEYRKPPLEPLYKGTAAPLLGAHSDALPDTTFFLGRRDELAEVVRWLGEPQVRLVSLLAPGGMGKTTLAARAVQEATRSWRAGSGVVVWTDLKGAPSVGEVAARILASLQADARPTDPDIAQLSPAARVAQVVRLMADRPVLLVLDNLESWLDPEVGTPHEADARALLEKAATAEHRGCVVLTSRLEVDLPVVPWERRRLLRLGRLGVEDARQLLLAQGVRGDPEAVRHVWERLGGTPRLLLLLGEMLRRRGCTDLARGLGRFPQLLAGAAGGLLGELWGELSARQRRVLQVLTALRPPAATADIDGVLRRLDPEAASAEEVLWTGLLPRALVAPCADGEAFAIEHPLIAEHAARQVENPAALHRAALEHFRERLASAEQPLRVRLHLSFVYHACLAGEYEEAASALADEKTQEDLFHQGQVTQTWEACRPLLDVVEQLTPGSRLGIGLLAGRCLEALGDYRAALGWFQRCRGCLGERAGTREEWRVLTNLGSVQRKLQRYQDAERNLLQAVQLARQRGDAEGQVWSLLCLSALERNQGRMREANGWATQAVELADQTGNVRLRARAREVIGRTYGRGQRRPVLEEALKLCDQASDLRQRARLLEHLADVARREGRYPEALDQVRSALALYEVVRDRTGEGIARHCLGLTLWQSGPEHRAEALAELRKSVRLAFDLDHPRELVNVLSSLALLFSAPGTEAVAAACYQTSWDLDQLLGHQRGRYRRSLDQLRQQVERARPGSWPAVEAEAWQRREALLEEASAIPAGRWQDYLSHFPDRNAPAERL